MLIGLPLRRLGLLLSLHDLYDEIEAGNALLSGPVGFFVFVVGDFDAFVDIRDHDAREVQIVQIDFENERLYDFLRLLLSRHRAHKRSCRTECRSADRRTPKPSAGYFRVVLKQLVAAQFAESENLVVRLHGMLDGDRRT